MKRWIIILLIALVMSILHLQLFFSSWGDSFEPLALDAWFNLRGEEPPPSDVAVIAMDESSYKNLNLPMDKAWPRALHAKLITKLADYGAKRVIMDVLFLGESDNAQADIELAEAFKLLPSVIGVDSGIAAGGSAAGSYDIEVLLEPPVIFAKSVEALALTRMPEDVGYIRRYVVPRSYITKDIPSPFEAAAGLPHNSPDSPLERDFIWYYGPSGTIPTYPYHQVLDTERPLPASTFKNKIIFVGLSLRSELGPAQKDSYKTPFMSRGNTFGVEIQATAAANLISKKWISRASKWKEGFSLFFATFVLCTLLFALRPQWGGAILIVSILTWLGTSYFLFLNGFFLPGAILTCILLPIAYLGSTFVYYLVTYRSQLQVEKAFQYYLSPEMAREMRNNPKGLALGGENVWATAIFTDIAGFSSITEGMLASDVSTMLNAYFTEVMNAIFVNKGTLIKFIGDAVFALWGAPIKVSDHARLACVSALEIKKAVERFNNSKRFPALHTRIGLHTGQMVVGNLGSDKRFDYTAIGDAVNLASRLEGINKYFGTTILISENVKKEMGNGFNILMLGTICVAGKSERVPIYSIFDTPISDEAESEWSTGLKHFRARRWEDAQACFSNAASKDERLKKTFALYESQIEHNKQNPLEEEWQGEVVFREK